MDKPVMNINMNFYDRINRIVLGSMMLIATMAICNMANNNMAAGIPPWVALLTLYPILTAIAAWDPFYAMSGAIFRHRTADKPRIDKRGIKGGKLALE